MAERHALALNEIAPHSGGVQQDVDHVVVKQVDFVNVQDAAVGGRQQARLKAAAALADSRLDVQRAHDRLFGGADGEFDQAHAATGGYRGVAHAEVAGGERRAGRAGVGAAGGHVKRGQQRGERAGGGGLGCALFAANQNAADSGVDGVEDEREFHPLLPDDGGEGEVRVLGYVLCVIGLLRHCDFLLGFHLLDLRARLLALF